MKKRMITCERSLFDALWCAAMILFVCAANVVAQDNVKRPPGNQDIVRRGLPACSVADKVEVTSFTLNSDRPLVGTNLTAKMNFRSKCPAGTADLRVPWEIRRITQGSSTRIGSGTETLAPGASQEVSIIWRSVLGTHNFFGSVTLTDGGTNNTSDDVVVTVSPPLVTQVLNYQRAKEAGATFDHRKEQQVGCTYIGQFDPAGEDPSGRISDLGYGQQTVVFHLRGLPPCGKASPEAFANFELKNGWKVKDVQVYQHPESDNGDWQWLVRPTNGSNNPYTRVRLQNRQTDPLGVALMFGIKIIIEGPEGTNPYQ